MSEPLGIRVAASAAREIREAAAWWIENRLKAPGALREDLDRAFELIARQPSVGAQVKNARLRGVRRVLLGRVRYYLYYRVTGTPERVEVVAMWHSSRGSDPRI